MVTTILVVLLIVIVGGGYAAWRYTQGQYYVGTDGRQVIIYRGVNQQVLGMSLSSVYQQTGIPLSHVPATDLPQVRSTITASSLADAQKTVSTIRQTCTCDSTTAAYSTWLAHKPTPQKVTKQGRERQDRDHHGDPAYKPGADDAQGLHARRGRRGDHDLQPARRPARCRSGPSRCRAAGAGPSC